MGQKLVTWNDLMRTNTKESKLFAFICKKFKVSGKFHEKLQVCLWGKAQLCLPYVCL